MERTARFRAGFLGLLALGLWTGCRNEPAPSDDSGSFGAASSEHDGEDHDGEDHEGHDHEGHEHSHMGIHGGHVVVLEPGHVHAEWTHIDEEEMIEVYLLDRPEAATAVKLVTQVQGQEPIEYPLESAPETLGKGGYQLKDPNLLTGIQMADGEVSRVTLVVETAEGPLKANITDDHDHDHAH